MLLTSSGAVCVSVVTVLPMFLTAGLAVQIGVDLGFSPARLGAAPGAFFGAMALSSVATGRVVERFGPLRTIRVVALAVAVLLMLVAVVAHSFPMLVGLLVVAGCANALAQPATNQLVAHSIPAARQGLAYGAKYSAIPIASMLSGLAVPVLGLTIGWRWAFAVFAVAAALAAAWPFPRLGSRAVTGDAAPAAPPLPRRLLVLLAVGVGMAAASGSAMAIFMVSSAVDAGWSEGEAGLLFAVASSVGIAARLLAGARADQRGRNHLLGVAIMLLTGAVGVAGLASGVPILYALGAPVAFGAGWGWPGLFILAVVTLNRSGPAAATSLTQVGTSIGCVIGPVGFGLVATEVSYAAAWTTDAVVLLLAAAVVLLGRSRVLRHLGADRPSPPVRPARPTRRHPTRRLVPPTTRGTP